MNRSGIVCMLGLGFAVLQSCKKTNAVTGGTDTTSNTQTTVITPPNVPVTGKTQGFFLDDWQPKTFAIPTSTTAVTPGGTAGVTVTVDVSQVLTKVSNYLYGNNTNPYMG